MEGDKRISLDQAFHINETAEAIETDTMYWSEERWGGCNSWETLQGGLQSGLLFPEDKVEW